jgi:hypothetical protein
MIEDYTMTSEETKVYADIEAFVFDEGAPDMSFADRLSKDNGWSRLYSLRVIEEYRKFAFLMVAGGHMVVPSDQVDQAWHQHLLYTRSWAEFCKKVLHRPVHHEPTRGGDAEKNRFVTGYAQTLQTYRRFFGPPPGDIWPDAPLRFGKDLHYRRVNTKDNLVISSSWLWGLIVGTAALWTAAVVALTT